MSITAPPSGLQPEDYERIEQAVMETARGRWFLLEYARRRRAAETERLLAAVERLERRVAEQGAAGAAAERARIGERLQDLAWTLRERGLDDGACVELEAIAREAIGEANLREPPGAPVRALPADVALEAIPDIARAPEEPAAAPLPAPLAEPTADPRLVALSRLDQLPLVEKFALFG